MTETEAEKLLSAAKQECLVFGKPDLDQMLDAVQHSAHWFECEQRRHLVFDFRRHPDMCVMQHVVNLDTLGNFLDAVIHRPQEVARRLNNQRR